jgi:hypothetical protein
MEDELDQVEEGKVQWTKMMRAFYDDFEKWLKSAKTMGAPKGPKGTQLISLLGTIQNWNPPEKSGTRVYDDRKFYRSVKSAVDAGRQLSAPQWEALLRMAVKYADQLPDLEQCAQKYGFTEELNTTREERAARMAMVQEWQQKRAAAAAAAPPQDNLADVFTAMRAIRWKAPEKESRRGFDEKKFFESLQDQVRKGRTLSDKQLKSLGRIAVRYKDELPDFAKIAAELHLDEKVAHTADPAAAATAKPISMDEVDALITKMRKITSWAEPKRVRNRVYDDQAFFESLAKQRAAGKVLTEKQAAALKKTAAKYSIA